MQSLSKILIFAAVTDKARVILHATAQIHLVNFIGNIRHLFWIEALGSKSTDIFDPAFTTKTSGTGLGMPIVKRTIDDYGGTIELESEPGAGTRVTVRLPAA